jgi:enoyl-CoA hydratase
MGTMMDELVIREAVAPGVARLTLNRPGRKNALSIDLRDAVTAALAGLAADGAVRAVVLAGAGTAFSAGFDLAEFQQAVDDRAMHDRLWRSSDAYHLALLRFPLPLVAAVQGPALGGGFDTAVLCDLRIADETAGFGHPEAAFADVVYGPLHDLVGGAAARDLCLTGRRIDAATALRLGLVSEVVAPAALAERAVAVAAGIARAPREVLCRTKAKIVARARIAFTTTLEL